MPISASEHREFWYDPSSAETFSQLIAETRSDQMFTTDRLLQHRAASIAYHTHQQADQPLFLDVVDSTAHNKSEAWFQWCLDSGIVVPSELQPSSPDLAVNEQSMQYTPNTGEIVAFDDALTRLKVDRYRGKRIVFAMGNFDIGHQGQIDAITNFKHFTGTHGTLAVLVGDDHSVQLRKGAGRPFVPHNQRMAWVLSQGVELVVPIHPPSTYSVDQLPMYYDWIHQQLSGIAHFRLVGDGNESSVIQYQKQCQRNNIFFATTNLVRSTSATQIGLAQTSFG